MIRRAFGTLIPSSIRGRFLAVVLIGAVLPLALIGFWLTRSVIRAGEELLHSELDQSLQKVADAIDQRWSYRSGDVALLAANDVAQRLLTPGQALTAADSAYLNGLFTTLSSAIPSFEYRDASGIVRWSTPVVARTDTTVASGQRGLPAAPPAVLTITLPVTSSPGTKPLGTMVAHLSVAALMPTDTALRLPNGAKLQIEQRQPHLDLLPAFTSDSLLARDRFNSGGTAWLGVHRSLADPAVDLHLAAPLAAYVLPFERAARAGTVTLVIVSLVVLLFTVYLITQLTKSLERLAVAADAVAGGDLDHRADAHNGDEVGRVGTAFNSMVDNLRRTLSELSKRQALAAVGEYAASLSHEVRNGLTAVRIDLQRAEEKAIPGAATEQLIGRALENVTRLESRVTASLRVARGSSTPRRRVELRHLLRSVSQSVEGAFGERGGVLSALPPDTGALWVLGDATGLEQLFLNLLINSAHACSHGGHTGMTIDFDGPDVCVAVTDTGTGILAEDLEHVLDPFFSTKEEGAGLGLAVARQTAAAHGGSLRIESVAGEGTRVEVRLPLAAPPTI